MITTLNGAGGLRPPESISGGRYCIGTSILALSSSYGNWALFPIRTSGTSRCPSVPGVPPSPRILRLDPARGKRDQLVHGPEIELLFDTRAMGFDGLGAQMEFLGPGPILRLIGLGKDLQGGTTSGHRLGQKLGAFRSLDPSRLVLERTAPG